MDKSTTQIKSQETYKAVLEASKNGELWGMNLRRKYIKLP